MALNYPQQKGIPIKFINTYSLQSGGANAFALTGYCDQETQKMGWWHEVTFREYICNDLACFSNDMSKNIKWQFGFVNVSGGMFHNVTDAVLASSYNSHASAA